jgi:hypothetical protein
MSFLAAALLVCTALASDGPTEPMDRATPLLAARVATAPAPAVAPPARLHQVSLAGRAVRLDAPRVSFDPGEGAELSQAVLQVVWTGEAQAVTVLAGDALLEEVGAGMFVLPPEAPAQLELVAWQDDRPTDIRIVRLR